jgi:hypothetical protein
LKTKPQYLNAPSLIMAKDAAFSGGSGNQPTSPALANPGIVDRDAEQRDHGNDHPQVHARIISEALEDL